MHPPVRASAWTPTHAHTNTDHVLWLGKGSYWRILSGKRTFSNKWWWTLDKKNIVSSSFFLSPHFTINNVPFMCFSVFGSGRVCSRLRGPPQTLRQPLVSHSKTYFSMRATGRAFCPFGWLVVLPVCVEAQSRQEKEKKVHCIYTARYHCFTIITACFVLRAFIYSEEYQNRHHPPPSSLLGQSTDVCIDLVR